MSGVAIESALFVDSAVRCARSGFAGLRLACSKLADGIRARPLLTCALVIAGSSSAAYAFIMLTPTPMLPSAMPADPPQNVVFGSGRPKCPECGVVESVRELAALAADPHSAATTAGGQGARSARTYEITLRMKDGSSHRFSDTNPANWRLGERVILIGEATRSRE